LEEYPISAEVRFADYIEKATLDALQTSLFAATSYKVDILNNAMISYNLTVPD
jgi:hypothetical protein